VKATEAAKTLLHLLSLHEAVEPVAGPAPNIWICSHDTGHMWEASSPHLSQGLYVKENQS